MHALHSAQKANIFRLRGSACMHTLVRPLPHIPVQLGWICQECEIPTDIALWVTEARKPSHLFKVHSPGEGSIQVLTYACRSRWSIGHLRPLAIALRFGLLWPFQTSWSLAVSALLQCLASKCCEAGLSSSSPAGSWSGLGV